MSSKKKQIPAVLIEAKLTEDGADVRAQNVILEEVTEDPGEVVYESSQSRGKSFSGASRAFSAGWDRMMRQSDNERLPN